MKDLSAILPLRTRTHALSLAIGAATWLAGLVAVYLVAPFAAGLGFFGAYAALEPGSAFGNVLALVIFTLWSALVLFVFRGSRLSPVTAVLGAHGLIGIGIFYPAAVMGFGLAHVVGYGDDAPAQGALAMRLVVSAGIALVLLVGTLVGRWMSNRIGRIAASQHTPQTGNPPRPCRVVDPLQRRRGSWWRSPRQRLFSNRS